MQTTTSSSVRPLLSRLPLTRREASLVAALALLTLVAVLAPALPAHMGNATQFADTRAWGALPNALDVLTNLPFAFMGVLGLHALSRLERVHEASWPRAAESLPLNTLDCAWLFFAGLIATAAASTFFHLQPDVLRLAADRAGMAIACAGIVGVAACEGVSPRAGGADAWFALAAGLLSVAIYHESGNVMPWAVVQFGSMALLLGLAMSRPRRHGPPALGLNLGAVVGIYAIATVFGPADAQMFGATGGWVAGHAVKHVIAALAALPVWLAVRNMTGPATARQSIRAR